MPASSACMSHLIPLRRRPSANAPCAALLSDGAAQPASSWLDTALQASRPLQARTAAVRVAGGTSQRGMGRGGQGEASRGLLACQTTAAARHHAHPGTHPYYSRAGSPALASKQPTANSKGGAACPHPLSIIIRLLPPPARGLAMYKDQRGATTAARRSAPRPGLALWPAQPKGAPCTTGGRGHGMAVYCQGVSPAELGASSLSPTCPYTPHCRSLEAGARGVGAGGTKPRAATQHVEVGAWQLGRRPAIHLFASTNLPSPA